MNKKLIILATLLLSSIYVFSQDIIVTKDSKRIDAKVLEVNINDIKYKDWENQNGPIYTILKSNIASILYQSGKVETFSATQPTSPEKQLPEAPEGMTLTKFKSMSDREQQNYFQKYVGGNISNTFNAGVKYRQIGTGLLIPGIVCSTAGLLCIVLGSIYLDDYYSYDGYYEYWHINNDAWNTVVAGTVLFPVGQALTIASIPINAIGGAKKRRAQNEFINTYFKDSSTKASFGFGVPKRGGLGLMLKF
jgi:hypothetical protein